jgi:hypothetical protein
MKMLAVLILTLSAAAGEPPPLDAASAMAPLRELCAIAMMDKADDAGDRAAIVGLCSCSLDGFKAVEPAQTADAFLVLWGEIAKLVLRLSDPNPPTDAEVATKRMELDMLKTVMFSAPGAPNAAAADQALSAVTGRLESIAAICVSGFAASGASAPRFDGMRFYSGLRALDTQNRLFPDAGSP